MAMTNVGHSTVARLNSGFFAERKRFLEALEAADAKYDSGLSPGRHAHHLAARDRLTKPSGSSRKAARLAARGY